MSQPLASVTPDSRAPSRSMGVLCAVLEEIQGLRRAIEAALPSNSKRDRERLSLGRDAVLSIGRAAELLPLADGDARAWLRAQGLVASLECAGRDKEVVHWGAVLERLQLQANPPAVIQEARPRRRLRRVDLG